MNARFGLEPAHYELTEQLLVNPLRALGCAISVFGSRARGDHGRCSDLDVLIKGEVSRSAIDAIRENLEESALPIKVDVVLANELAHWYRSSVIQDAMEWDSGNNRVIPLRSHTA